MSVPPMDRFARVVSAGLRTGAPSFAAAILVLGFATQAVATVPRLGLVASLVPGIGTLFAIGGGFLMAVRVRRALRFWKVLLSFLVMQGGFIFYLVTVHLNPALAPTTASFALSVFKTGVMAFSVNAGRQWGPAVMAFVSFGTASIVSVIIGRDLGYAWGVDGPAQTGMLFVIFIAVGFAIARRRGVRARRVVQALEDEDTLRQTRGVVRSQAAAVVHDTVLNDLAVLATTDPGTVSPRLAERLKATLDLLASPNWVRGSDAVDEDGTVTKPGAVVHRAIERATAAGLHVKMSGDVAALAGLAASVEHALGNAVEQCLINTLKHADTDEAEITVLGDETEVSVMVADSGSGFEVDEVRDDRMGLRSSIRTRIEDIGGSVRIFARPGVGTTILIAVPKADAAVLQTEA